MDEQYSPELFALVRKSENFRALLVSSVKDVDTRPSAAGGSSADRAETVRIYMRRRCQKFLTVSSCRVKSSAMRSMTCCCRFS